MTDTDGDSGGITAIAGGVSHRSGMVETRIDVITSVDTVFFPMILELKLRKIGSSVGIVLPKEALAFLKAGEGDTLSVTDAADGTLRVSPTKPEVSRQLEIAQDIMRRYRNTLRELAK